MSAAQSAGRRPVFIISHARTGSTLLRYIVDAHPAFCCPAEVALGKLCRALKYTIGLTRRGLRSSGFADPAEVRAAVRGHVDEIMERYCAEKGKPRWCDKSTNNVEHLDEIAAIFPDAQYVCLHRNCLDVAYSLLELFRYGFSGHYAGLVSRSPTSLVSAMIDSWIEATQNVLAFEALDPSRCVRLRYEDLVAAPVPSVAAMFAFLQEPFEPAMLGGVFVAAHDPGPGDFKIQFTSAVLPNRMGKGRSLPLREVNDRRLADVNALHAELGYEPISRDASPTLESILRSSSRVPRSLAHR